MKRTLLTAVLVLLLVLVLAGCTSTNLGQTLSQGASKQKCHEWAESMIPEQITLAKNQALLGLYPGFGVGHETVYWADGTTPITVNPGLTSIYVQAGSSAGQNVNNYYPKISNELNYVGGQVVSEEGVILGKNTFTMTFVLKKLSEKRSEGGYDKQDFEFAEYEIIRCDKVSS